MQCWLILPVFALLISTCPSQKVGGAFVNVKHNVKGDVVIIDEDTIEILNFHYDGKPLIFGF